MSSIEQICKSKRWWKSDKIMVFLQSHLQTLHEELIINLADTLGKVRFSNETCYFLPQEWSQNTEKFQKDIVIPCFILAGHKAGFALAWMGGQEQAGSHQILLPKQGPSFTRSRKTDTSAIVSRTWLFDGWLMIPSTYIKAWVVER